MNNNNTLCIAEWQSFGVEDIQEAIADKSREKAQRIFGELQNFANQKGNFDDREGNHIFLTPYRSNHLKARNFVGLIQTKSGFCLEILPKTFRANSFDKTIKCSGDKNCECQVCQAKQILLNMLRTLRDSPFKQSHISSLKTHRFPLLEVFANMFLDEVERLIKRGIKSDYVVREENRTFIKGKLLFSENLKYNFAHKERFFTACDEFIADIAPNRLIARTILFLSTQGFSPHTSGRISQARFIFADIRPSKSIDKDFALCPSSRHYKDYELLLAWCEIFLRHKSFMPYQGGDKAFALLFDMNKLFESFVAWHLKRACKKYATNKKCSYKIKSQDKSRHLLETDKERNKFQIIPDIVCRNIKNNKQTLFIADTKWKILDSSESNNYGIAQGDLYQMFAYLAKYQCTKGYLIYPKIVDNESIQHKSFTYKAQVCFYDKNQTDKHDLQKIMLEIYFFDIKKPIKSSQEFFDKFLTTICVNKK